MIIQKHKIQVILDIFEKNGFNLKKGINVYLHGINFSNADT